MRKILIILAIIFTGGVAFWLFCLPLYKVDIFHRDIKEEDYSDEETSTEHWVRWNKEITKKLKGGR